MTDRRLAPLRAALIAALLALALFVAPGHAAIRSDGTNTQHLASLLSSPGNFPASGAVTIMQWHKLNVDHDAQKVLFAYHDNNNAGDGYDAIIFLTEANGTTLDINTYNDGVVGQTSAAVQTITVNTWYHYAIVRNGSTIKLYIGSETTASMLVATVTDSTLEAQGIHWRFTATGTSAAGASPDASIERVKVFTGELTLAQINNERAILTPDGTSGLRSYNPLTTAGSYGASRGSSRVMFSEQGGSNFSTVSGPSPIAVPSGAARSTMSDAALTASIRAVGRCGSTVAAVSVERHVCRETLTLPAMTPYGDTHAGHDPRAPEPGRRAGGVLNVRAVAATLAREVSR